MEACTIYHGFIKIHELNKCYQGNTNSYLVHTYFTFGFSAISKSKGPGVLNYFQYILIFFMIFDIISSSNFGHLVISSHVKSLKN